MNMFGTLPVVHLIGKVLVVHGCLFSDESVTIDTIQDLVCYGQPPEQGPMNDILWSEAPSPTEVVSIVTGTLPMNNIGNLFVILKANSLELLIQGEGYLVQHNGKCITVLSAPNYIGRISNKGAVVYISFAEDDSLNFEQFAAQPVPPNF